MAKNKTTKRALLMSLLSLLMCVSMLIGTTFAWFTDSVTSGNNVIKSGSLDVVMEWKDATATGAQQTYKDASEGAIFNYEKWEPGYVEAKNVRIHNDGSLALKYNLYVDPESDLTEDGVKLAKAIDVYFAEGEYTLASREMTELTRVGTLAEVLDGMPANMAGDLLENETDTVTIALKMQESAGNEYQDKSIGGKFRIILVATQQVYEYDSFGREYDQGAPLDFAHVSNANELRQALQNKKANIILTDNITVDGEYAVDYDAKISGGYTIGRAADGSAAQPYTGTIFTVKANNTLTLENVTVDGGAAWGGAVDPVLQRGTVNSGVGATGALVATEAKATVVLNKGAVLQNNDGANAVNLGTRVGAKLILNGGEIINNSSDAGAIWGGGEIVMNDGKINGNYGGIGGAIRVVTNVGTVLTMNGGEMNHNYSAGVGGAIWAGGSKSNNVYVLNGGEMAYNYSAEAGGAIYAGYYETVKIGGTFKMHDNSAPSVGAIRFHNHAVFEMTGGEIYDNGANSLFLDNNSASIIGGKITDSFGYNGGLGLVWGEAEVDGVINYNLSTNHNTAYLAESFNTLRFTVNEASANFASFNFKPAAGYTYTEGDEAKLICMNAGFETYWDTNTQTFRLQAK